MSYFTENAGESTRRAVRANRGQGGHAFQLANALKPVVGDQACKKTNDRIPADIPANAMAPQPLLGKARVISVMYFYQL